MSDDRQGHARRFRSALGAFATGVTIVTTRDADGHDIGLTANSFNSVSLDPPMVLWSLAKSARSLPVFLAASHFAVHVLAADQEELSLRFATRGSEKFSGLDLERGPAQVPLLRGCSARFQCRTAFRHEGGDHVIFVGAVEAFDQSDRTPLLFHGGRYALAVQKEAVPPTPQDSAEPDSSFSQDFLIYLLARAQFQLFLSLRRDLEQHGLSEVQWFVLSILGVSDDRSVAELDRLIWYTGHRVTYELLASLTAAGFADLRGSYDPQARVTLTDTGRRAVIELVAAAKAAEDHAERNLGTAEVRILKRALRTIIRETDPGAPPLLVPTYPE
jgi:3-hydroxy-9,10-secoandrosta-1,3,5(10)-triene-9,17-dione monooxygenase reductase component